MEQIEIGKIVSTHGIKGELKLLSDFLYLDKVLQKNFNFYINGLVYKLTSYRLHKQYVLIKLNDYNDINDVLFLVGNKVLVQKSDLHLKNDEYLLEELWGANVYYENKLLGVVEEILKGVTANYLKIKEDTKSYLVPINKTYIRKYTDSLRRLDVQNIAELRNL